MLFEVQGNQAELTNPNEGDSLTGFGFAGNGGYLDNGAYTRYGAGANYATGPVGNPIITDTSGNTPSDTTGRHTDSANYAFADGHVKVCAWSRNFPRLQRAKRNRRTNSACFCGDW